MLSLNEVYVGEPAVLGLRRDTPVLSAIRKTRVDAPELALSELNLNGDRQADLTVHGGPDKAVYVYPAEHYPSWTGEGYDVAHGDFGENLSVRGMLEDETRIGDVWAWGDAIVQVSQPRNPCFKLAMRTGRKDVVPAMISTGRCGWYLRVLRPGTVPTAGPLDLIERAEEPTVSEAFLASSANYAQQDVRELAERVLASTALPKTYLAMIQSKVDRTRELPPVDLR
ncbi:MOSC domain-containing protein YiiM [Amycolatopsis echigonensis]|uniref:MOSC domain-containing protein YiiM n=1 Tax=Amycolatopsis echigonensis TaxID=2576905 RepID=A0A2N3WJS1_9PSEU|nr:MOSC domain-containing protein YiiM [Amycolatopsis niigatensis]